jgi:hypothetical protein
MKVGFFSSKLTLRGTEIALYDYANYNETLLGNTSVIITRPLESVKFQKDTSDEAYSKFSSRFVVRFTNTRKELDDVVSTENIDVLYVIKGGWVDDIFTTVKSCRNVIHLVFSSNFYVESSEYDHSKCAAISCLVSRRIGGAIIHSPPVIPHIVSVYNTMENLRSALCIPDKCNVFGTYSGSDENVDYVLSAIKNIVDTYLDVYFIFMNITPFIKHPHVIFLPGTTDLKLKRQFINTCDAMLYMRKQGETFGLACGEFSISEKPVICSRYAQDTQHLTYLDNAAIHHSSESELIDILTNWNDRKSRCDLSKSEYLKFTPEYVMKIFEDTFLR